MFEPVVNLLDMLGFLRPKRVVSSKKVNAAYGDVICAKRKDAPLEYQHFGIYCDRGRVIHFSSKEAEISGANSVMATDFETFAKGDKVFALAFPEKHYGAIRLNPVLAMSAAYGVVSNPGLERVRKMIEAKLRRMREIADYHLYTPEETVKRAESRLGESGYNLICNNCEHFAIWCKTGVHESHQVSELIGDLEFIFKGLEGSFEGIADDLPVPLLRHIKF